MLSKLTVVGIFIAGLLMGWLIATFRIGGRFRISLRPVGSDTPWLVTKTVRTMELKCGCGSVWKFRNADGPVKPGYQPYPTGSSYVCPNCGRVTDLNEIQKLEQDLKA
jgi:hypothetical protein